MLTAIAALIFASVDPPHLDPAILELEDRVSVLEARLEQQRALSVKPIPVNFTGYVDFGFFYPIGDGVGWQQDFGNQALPQFKGEFGWLFYGDILATMVNSRGEPADLGEAPGSPQRFDSVDSKGAPGFLVNEVNFGVEVGLGESAMIRTSINFVPRTGSDFDFGDFIELDLAEIEWLFTEDGNHSVFAGKIFPVFGIEYKERRAQKRFGITPSLIQRYTSGPQLGLKYRGKFLDDWLIVAAAFTNGSSTIEPFHFYDEVDSNAAKTFSGRLATSIAIDSFIEQATGHRLEIGVSGEVGAQDRARDNAGLLWFAGVDLTYRSDRLTVKGQWLTGAIDGSPTDRAWLLELGHSGYLEVDYTIISELGLMVRGGVRDAIVSFLDERIYVTKSWRLTVGLRSALTEFLILKAEYLRNEEFGDVPGFDNDVFTTSLVAHY